MKLKKIRVLLLEDNPTDAEANVRELRRAGYDPVSIRVQTEAGFLSAIESSIDLILSDYKLFQFDALSALELLRRRGLDIPFILVTNALGEEVAVHAIRQGADDLLLKKHMRRLRSAVAGAMENKRRRQSESEPAGDRAAGANKRKIEQLVSHARRMESLNTLAGGVAHDLNNALAPILMSVEVLSFKITDPDLLEIVKTIKLSAQQGAEVIKQILTFSSRTQGQRVVLDLLGVIGELQKEIKKFFPANIVVEIVSLPRLWKAVADPAQLRLALLNLCLNARDAMPNGGRITIGLENQVFNEACALSNPEAKPGAYVVISVMDTGPGVSAKIRDRIFDPFFTTKVAGKGTGLGLAMVWGIAKNHDGFVSVNSEAGQGAVFKLYIPAGIRMKEKTPVADERTRTAMSPHADHHKLILVVDDEESMRRSVKQVLERHGYQVKLAANGAEAVSIYSEFKDAIAVVLTDMAMPGMDGSATIAALKSINPNVAVIGSSGCGMDDKMAKTAAVVLKYFLSKPYRPAELLKVLSQALAESQRKF